MNFLMPGALLVFKVLTKLFAHSHPQRPDYIRASNSLPVDLNFLAASLLAGRMVTSSGTGFPGPWVIFFVTLLALAVWTVAASKIADEWLDTAKFGRMITLTVINSIATLALLVIVINLKGGADGG